MSNEDDCPEKKKNNIFSCGTKIDSFNTYPKDSLQLILIFWTYIMHPFMVKNE